MKPAARIVTILIFALVMIAAGMRAGSQRHRAIQPSQKRTNHTSSSIQAALPCKGSDDSAIALCEFAALTNAYSLWTGPADTSHPISTQPIWQTWLDKCNLGVGPCVPGDVALDPNAPNPCPLIPASLEGFPLLKSRKGTPEKLGLDLVTQIREHNVEIQLLHHGKHSLTPFNELSSVLFSNELCPEALAFNTKAAAERAVISANHKGLTGPDRDISAIGKPDDFKKNSTAIKLIWELVFDKDPYYAAHVYYPNAEIDESPAQPFIANPFSWRTKYPIDGDESMRCPPTATQPSFPMPGVHVPPLPVNCFYHILIDQSNPAVQQVLQNNETNVIPPPPPPRPGQKAFLILVGAHVMVFNEEHPLWQWMTFYWTPDISNQPSAWANPWQHYHMMTTSISDRTQPLPPHHEKVANPYLEGSIDSINSNCLSCHSLAEYNPAVTNFGDQVLCAQSFVDVDTVKYPDGEYPQTETDAINKGYFNGAIRTHFLWSLSTNSALYAGATGTSHCVTQPAPANTAARH